MLREAGDYKASIQPEGNGHKAELMPTAVNGQSFENHTGIYPLDSRSSPAEQLSQHLFSSPQDFLQALKTDINHTDLHGGDLTALDLLDTGKLMADPKLKAAADIAARHFGDLEKMTQNKDLFGDDGLQGSFVDTLADAYKGDVSKEIRDYEGYQGATAAVSSLAAVAMGGVAAVTAPETLGLGTYLSGTAAVGFASVAADSAYNMAKGPAYLRAEALKDKQALSSWAEFNC